MYHLLEGEADMKSTLKTLSVLILGVVLGTFINSSHGQREAKPVPTPTPETAWSGKLTTTSTWNSKPAAVFSCPEQPRHEVWYGYVCGYDKMDKITIYLDVMKGLKTIELKDGEKSKIVAVDEFRTH